MAEKEYIERGKINDYISKLREYVSASVGLSQAEYSFISDILTAFENFPAADAVSVVRCKDCKHAYINSFAKASGVVSCKLLADRSCGAAYATQQDDFCSYGVRKENENA